MISLVIGGIWFEIIAVGLGIASLCTGRKWRGFAISGILVSVLLIAAQIAFAIFAYTAYQEETKRWEEHNRNLTQSLVDELDNLAR